MRSAKSIITHSDAKADRAIYFDDFEASEPYIKENDNTDENDAVVFSHEAEERSLHVGHVINPSGIETRQTDERDDEEDGGQGGTPGKRSPLVPRATMNAETPLANRPYLPNRRGNEEESVDPTV